MRLNAEWINWSDHSILYLKGGRSEFPERFSDGHIGAVNMYLLPGTEWVAHFKYLDHAIPCVTIEDAKAEVVKLSGLQLDITEEEGT